MRLLAQALRLCFWAMPLQRVATVAGLGLMLFATLVLAQEDQSSNALNLATVGYLIALLPPLGLGGPMWRALAAQRMIALAPAARTKLLLAALAMIALGALGSVLLYVLLFLWLSPVYRMPLDVYVSIFTSAFAFGTWWTIASFIAARSALAMLAVFATVLAYAYAFVVLGARPFSPLLEMSWVLDVVAGTAFGAWYLRVRRIARSAWFSRGGAEAALASGADTGGVLRQHSPSAARQRLLFRGPDRLRIVLQWVAAIALLLGLQLVWARLGEHSDPVLVSHVLFASLPLLLAGMALAADSLGTRLRSLWLAGGLSRPQMFTFAERQCAGLALGLALLGALCYLLLWWVMPWHPPVPAAWGIAALVGGMLVPAYAALWGASGWRWLVAGVVLVPLVETYWQVSLFGRDFNAVWLLVPVAATVALRWAARRRWLKGDMPRAISVPAS